MHVVFYGPEGSGKGTQAKLLAQKAGIPHLVSGDLVRKYAQEDAGIMGRICSEALDKGHYVADSEMYVLWKQRFKEADTQNGWIIDGFPRNLTQSQFLARKIEKYNQQLDVVFFLEVPETESIKRLLQRGRVSPDGSLHDSPQRIKERLKHYAKGMKGVLSYYEKRGILTKINGVGTVESIHQSIVNHLKKLGLLQ